MPDSITWEGMDQQQEIDVRLVEAELRRTKTCSCGEPLTNDEIGEKCPCCGLDSSDMIFMMLNGRDASTNIH